MLLGAGRTKEAKARFDEVLKNDPQSVQGLIGLANILLDEGQTEDVRDALQADAVARRRATRRLTHSSATSTSVGSSHRQALPYLEKAVEIQPKITQNRLNLAACLIEVKQFARAQTMLDEILSEHPRFPGAAVQPRRALRGAAAARGRASGVRSPKWRTIRTASRRASTWARC